MEISPEIVIFARDFIIFFAIYLTVALSLNLEYGYAGVPNFGKVFSVAAGAFVVGSIPGRIVAWFSGIGAGLDYIDDNTAIVTEVNQVLEQAPLTGVTIFIVTLAVAGIVGAVLGLVACYPAIRLREDYLAITLLAMGEAVQVIGYNYRPIIKGNIGVLVPDPFKWAADLRYAVFAVFIVGICLLALFYVERLVRSPLGRMLRAIRDNENVAESLGKDVTRIRMRTIIVASVIGSIAGALDAFKGGGVISTSYRRGSWTFWPWLIVVLGGPANNTGVVLGTFVFTALRRFIDYYKGQLGPFLPFSVVWLEPLLFGVMIILIQMYRPEGIMKEKPTPTLSRSRLRRLISKREGETDSPPDMSEEETAGRSGTID